MTHTDKPQDELIPKSGKLTDLQRELVILHSNPEWWKSKFQNGKPITSEYDDADWWRFHKDETTLTLEEVDALISKRVRVRDRAARRLMESTKTMDDGCIEWTGALDGGGYGSLHYNDGQFKTVKAHRVAYYLFVGDIAEGMTIDHLCNNRPCVNVEHMIQATNSDNAKRGKKPLEWIDHCSKGHKFTPKNTIIKLTNMGKARVCRICRNKYQVGSNRIQMDKKRKRFCENCGEPLYLNHKYTLIGRKMDKPRRYLHKLCADPLLNALQNKGGDNE